MRKSLLFVAVALSLAAPLFAQPQGVVDHIEVGCLAPDRNTIITARITTPGTPRAFYRRAGTEDWCSVDGVRMRNVATMALPPFEHGVDVEYFIITIEDNVVTGRTPSMYRVGVRRNCGAPTMDDGESLITNCPPPGAGNLGSVLGAGYMLQQATPPPPVTPVSPEQQ